MAFKGTNYENKDIRKSTEDLINNGFGAFNGEDDVTPGQNLDAIVNNTAQIKDRLHDGDGTPVGTLIRQLLDYTDTLISFTGLIRDYTQPVVNSQVGTEMIVATGTLANLKADYSAWILANPSAVIISAVPINLSSERGLLITYYE